MPIMGGIDATKIIRSEISKDLPIVALTADAMQEDQDNAMAAGMNAVLTKPISISKLRDTVLQFGMNGDS